MLTGDRLCDWMDAHPADVVERALLLEAEEHSRSIGVGPPLPRIVGRAPAGCYLREACELMHDHCPVRAARGASRDYVAPSPSTDTRREDPS